jgi:hypothetical protein
MRELLFGLVLFIAAACVVVGVAHYSSGLAWITAGPLLALLAWLVLSDDDADVVPPVADGVDL